MSQSLKFAGLMLFSALSASFAVMSKENQVVIGSRMDSLYDQVSGNVSVLSEQALLETSAEHIQQLLSQIPGVITQRGNGQESLPGIRSAVLTGAGACGNVMVMEEGIPVRGPAFCNVNELFDTHFEQATSLDVVRGPNSAYYGSNSMLGSVNLSLASKGENRASLELGENAYVRAKGAVSYSGDESFGRLYLTHTDTDSFRDESGYNQQKLSWRHEQDFGLWSMKAGFTAARLKQETAGFIVGLDSYRDPELAKQNLDPNAFRQSESFRAWARMSRPIGDGMTLQFTPIVRHTDMSFRLHFLPGDPLEENSQSGFAWQSSLRSQKSDAFAWVVGFDGDLSEGELRQTQDQATSGSAFLQATIPSGTHYDYQVDAKQLGLFGNVDWKITNRLSLRAGLRAEHTEYDYNNRSLDGRTKDDGSDCGFGGCRYSRPADREDSFENLSPKLELNYMVSDKLSMFAIASSAYRAPQATELYRLQREQTVAALDNVEASNLELGFRYLGESTSLSVTAYLLEQENVIIRDSDFFNVDGTETKSHGLEFSYTQALGEQWSWKLAGTIADHQYASDQVSGDININGNQIDTAPKQAGSLSLNWKNAQGVSSQLQFQHVGSYYLDPENAHSYPGHTVANLRVQYQFGERWRTALRVINLADTEYAERADFSRFTDERYFPGQPRTIFASVERTF